MVGLNSYFAGVPQYPEQNMTSSPAPHFNAKTPSSWDWRDHGIVSPIKNQRQCGSCAAFAAVATIESCFAQKTGVIADLSEEHLVNCLANNGCSGWYSNQYLEDIVGKNGKKSESYSNCKIRDTKQSNANILLKTSTGGRLEQEFCCSYTATDNHCTGGDQKAQ